MSSHATTSACESSRIIIAGDNTAPTMTTANPNPTLPLTPDQELMPPPNHDPAPAHASDKILSDATDDESQQTGDRKRTRKTSTNPKSRPKKPGDSKPKQTKAPQTTNKESPIDKPQLQDNPPLHQSTQETTETHKKTGEQDDDDGEWETITSKRTRRNTADKTDTQEQPAFNGRNHATTKETAPQAKKRRRRRRRRQRPAAAASRGGTVEPARGGSAAGTTAAPGGDSTAATAHVRPPPPAACGKGGGGRRRRDAASGKTATTAGPDIESALQEAEARFRMVLHAEMEAACLTLRESLSRNTNKKEAQHQDDRMAATAAQPSRDQATQTAWPKKMTISRAAQASLEGKEEAVERQDSSVQTKEFVNHRAELVDSERLDDASPRDVYQMSFLQSRELRRRKEEALNEQSRRQREEQEAERDRKREAATARRERQRQHWQHGK
ncbi:MAP7 domain-containing protein 1-like [Schistocerca serialis cubense]|uniref:MAP7 domain-containing protein 1-like n=1 Tax=Schistocerca serialis cubense TaxID=2023355 RepID=UPI00214F3E82|nr:MAP7 domain-containing protein 1-like [Schistocerca serialis cubense]